MKTMLVVALFWTLTGCAAARRYFVMPPDVVTPCDPPPLHPDIIVGSSPCLSVPK